MESLELITAKWNYGAYDLSDMLRLVQKKQINEKEFKKITGYDYKGVRKSGKK